MLNWLKTRAEDRCKAKDLYGAIVTGARRPAFYSGCGVEDTPEGRYEMIALHLFLVIDHLKGQGPEADRVAQRVMEAFVTDMDDSMREMGVGDLSVGKKVKRSTAGLYERFAAYRDAMAHGKANLAGQLAVYVPGLEGAPKGAAAIARFVEDSHARFAELATGKVLAGTVPFADVQV